jgi:hypothetical protein
VLVGCALLLLVATVAQAGRVQLPEGHPVKVTFPQGAEISSGKLARGVTLGIELAEPIKIGPAVIVEKGATGTAVVKEAKSAGRGGSPGKIVVEFVDLEPKGEFKLPEGETIKLQGEESKEGKGKKTLSYILGFGLFIKGGQGVITADSVYTAEIAETVMLESE